MLINRRINQLVRDVPLPVRPDDLAVRPWDRDEVHRVFDTLQFRVLRDRLYATLSTAEPEADEGFTVDVTVLEPGAGGGLARRSTRPAAARTGVACAGTWASGTGTPDRARPRGGRRCRRLARPRQVTEADDDQALAAWLADPARPKAMHDMKGPLLAMAAHGWNLARRDQRHGAVCLSRPARPAQLRPRGPRPALPAPRAARRDRGRRPAEPSTRENDGASPEALVVRARAVIDLADVLDAELEQRGGTRLLRDVELPLVDVLAGMERTGIAVDTDHLAHLHAHFAGEVKAAADAAYAVLGREFNLGSPKQLQVILFDELGLPKTKKIKTGYTTDADALQWLYAQTEHPLLDHLLRHRDVAPAAGHRRGPRAGRRRRRAHPHLVQPDRRLDRPAVLDRAQPAEHPDPH